MGNRRLYVVLIAVAIAIPLAVLGVRHLTAKPPPVLVAAANLDCFQPVWSPRGKTIAYLREESNDTYVSLYDVATGQSRDLTRICRDCDYDLVWSPEGDRIAYWSEWNSNEPVVKIIDVDDGSIEQVVRGKDPTWSPDGRRLAFVAYPQLRGARKDVPAARDVIGGELGVVNRVTKEVRKITEFPVAKPVWSPRGDKIAFLYVAPDRQWTRRWLTKNPGRSDRTMESFVDGAVGSDDIGTIWPDGKVLNRVTQGGPWGNVRWTPEGDRLLATRYTSGTHGEKKNGELWILEPNGGQSKRLLEEKIALDEGYSAFFLPGGDEVVFEGKLASSVGGHGRDLFYVDVAEGKPRRLENEHTFKGRFTPSPDGNEVAYEIAAEYRTLEIWKMTLDRPSRTE